jgi:hypothetical protein
MTDEVMRGHRQDVYLGSWVVRVLVHEREYITGVVFGIRDMVVHFGTCWK